MIKAPGGRLKIIDYRLKTTTSEDLTRRWAKGPANLVHFVRFIKPGGNGWVALNRLWHQERQRPLPLSGAKGDFRSRLSLPAKRLGCRPRLPSAGSLSRIQGCLTASTRLDLGGCSSSFAKRHSCGSVGIRSGVNGGGHSPSAARSPYPPDLAPPLPRWRRVREPRGSFSGAGVYPPTPRVGRRRDLSFSTLCTFHKNPAATGGLR